MDDLSLLSRVEQDAAEKIAESLGLHLGVGFFIGAFPGMTECAVFDIGYLNIGDTSAFKARTWAFRATLDLYSRSREELQKWLTALLLAYPFSTPRPDGDGEIKCLRLAPQSAAVGNIKSVTISMGDSEMNVLTASVDFDVVFTADGKKPFRG